MKSRDKFEKISSYGVFFVLIAMLVLFSFIAPHFFELNNFFNVSRQICTLGIVAVGMTIVMITGGIDLSVGYQISVINVTCAWLMVHLNVNPVIAALIGITIGVGIGFINGLIIVKSGVAPLIVTLAVLNTLNGISYIISKGLPIFGFPKSFTLVGQGNIGGIPISLIIMAVIFILGGIYSIRYT
jgi:ribose/xylose/arabinose/galactoside ABC-type transport system permease subunit